MQILRARVKSEEKQKERATLTMNAWFPGRAIQAIIGKIDHLCGAAEHTDVWCQSRLHSCFDGVGEALAKQFKLANFA